MTVRSARPRHPERPHPLNNASHHTVLLQEAVDALRIAPDGVYVDATFGRGGHSMLMLQSLGPRGRLIAFDQDPDAIAAAAQCISDARFEVIHAPFSELKQQLARRGIEQIDGLLADLGVSSPQLDEASRGFSFRADGPLDMRMDPTRGVVVLTSRCSYEMAEKVAVLGARAVVCISAPTYLAVQRARTYGITLVGMARGDGVSVYTFPDCVTNDLERRA